jgi:ParB/RepB/Spo0J family partition protein
LELEFHQLDLRYEALRVRRPEQERRLLGSLSERGQQVPIVVVAASEPGRFVVIDGHKRVRALRRLRGDTVMATVWSMNEAEALVLDRSLRQAEAETALEQGWLLSELHRGLGLDLESLARRFDRSPSWVSRRLGLVERLHPELLAAVRTGLLAAGVARRLLGLPPGNQLELAAVATQAGLTTGETELLVRLWQQTSEPAIRRFLLTAPRRALQNARPETGSVPPDPRLSERGRRLARALAVLRGVALRLLDALRPLPPRAELALLAEELAQTAQTLPRALAALGAAQRCVGGGETSGLSATPTSAGCSTTATPSRGLPAPPGST